jgi:hypothetical protein
METAPDPKEFAPETAKIDNDPDTMEMLKELGYDKLF